MRRKRKEERPYHDMYNTGSMGCKRVVVEWKRQWDLMRISEGGLSMRFDRKSMKS